jgi:hypothetical protein
MYKLQSDVKIARKKRLHVIFDNTGTVCWTGATIDGALFHLWEKGELNFDLEGDDHSYRLQIVAQTE